MSVPAHPAHPHRRLLLRRGPRAVESPAGEARGARRSAGLLLAVTSRQAAGPAVRLARCAADLVRVALPGAAARRPWRELANKLEAFEHFQRAPALAGLAREVGAPLEGALERAAELGAYRSLWTIEGLGYARAESAWIAGRSSEPILPPSLAEHWHRAAVPLYAGAGLSFAVRFLTTERAPSPAGLARWLAAWEESAGPGWRGIAAEALGFLARHLRPRLVAPLAGLLGDIEPRLGEHLWHGVGRGLYFLPAHAMPHRDAHGRALAIVHRELPAGPPRRNATTGLSWALALVNIRHPDVVARALERTAAEIADPADATAVANGISSALLAWHDLVGLDAHLAAFLAHRPEPPRDALWRELVVAPATAALEQAYPRLDRLGGPAALFRCPPVLWAEEAEGDLCQTAEMHRG